MQSKREWSRSHSRHLLCEPGEWCSHLTWKGLFIDRCLFHFLSSPPPHFFLSSISGPEISWQTSLKLLQSKSFAYVKVVLDPQKSFRDCVKLNLKNWHMSYCWMVLWSSGTVLLFRETPSWRWAAWPLSSLSMRATCLLIAAAALG